MEVLKININNDFTEIMNHTHLWNWHPDWDVVQKIYNAFPESYSVLTPFAFSYLEELIRSTTSEYGIQIYDDFGNPKKRKVGMALIRLAIDENKDRNSELVSLLEKMKTYYQHSQPIDKGDNRNSVAHGIMHSRFWEKTSFESLIHDISLISKHAGF
ncbi:hypothetical protein [Paenibacillus agaridevorans]|uniref:hypothetical protein n=1 Tax=Paenibacillus agaridevorans TaxID=171404 RepID=UPI001BE41644|nr:hypothetical protein [Paenibacillus agaridevorans]